MLQLKQLSKSFSSSFKPILSEFSLTLKKGDFCVLLGSNGSGKSTLLKALSGEYTLDSGTILLDQQVITSLPIHARASFISSVSQDIARGTVQELTLLENLSLSLKRGKKASFSPFSRQRQYLCHQIAALNLGLEQYLDTPLSALSGGQKQMIATVMATLCQPKLLLLDEHCSALDPKAQSMLMAFTARMVQEHQITTLMITHNLNDALNYGNRLIMLHEGNIVVDMNDKQKRAASISQLLNMFHTYEDSTFINKKEYCYA
ncbi:MAG: hypothetical protein BGO43_09270 [Gammaproteobacteria bacterium 39-13]|nr:ATP-binding cassette domain-containing protein [Gammaproteobacteria bacterium]OJV93832.1 MAG: hypothetical protein BGO43_09270 [Gammaproteobacteria bacterium 39-13]